MEQCQRCNELWLALAVAAAELTRAEESRAECDGTCAVGWAGQWYRASADRAAAQTKLKIHLALAHPEDIGRGATAGVTEFAPGNRRAAPKVWISLE